jgi:hypothetical protein
MVYEHKQESIVVDSCYLFSPLSEVFATISLESLETYVISFSRGTELIVDIRCRSRYVDIDKSMMRNWLT